MAEQIVQKLSATKQRRSLGESKKKEKAKSSRKPTRTTVVNVRDIEWPDVDENKSKKILELIGKIMKCLNIRLRHVPLNEIRKVPPSERSEFRKQWAMENSIRQGYDISNFTLKRSDLSIGVNCCTKAIEINELVGLIIEKEVDPQIITKLLIPIAHSKSVPIISISGLNLTFKKACGIRCIALGFKRACEDVAHRFYPLLNFVKENSVNYNDMVSSEVVKVENEEPLSESLVSSMDDDGEPTSASNLPSRTFSVHEEITKLAAKVKATKKRIAGSKEKSFIEPKIRRVTPK